jgi:hypothetical protein
MELCIKPQQRAAAVLTAVKGGPVRHVENYLRNCVIFGELQCRFWAMVEGKTGREMQVFIAECALDI